MSNKVHHIYHWVGGLYKITCDFNGYREFRTTDKKKVSCKNCLKFLLHRCR